MDHRKIVEQKDFGDKLRRGSSGSCPPIRDHEKQSNPEGLVSNALDQNYATVERSEEIQRAFKDQKSEIQELKDCIQRLEKQVQDLIEENKNLTKKVRCFYSLP